MPPLRRRTTLHLVTSHAKSERRLGWPRRLLRGVFAVVAALWLVLEEWVWDGLVALTKWVARLPVFRGLEARIQRLGPKAAMAAFVVPWLLMLPIKVLGLWLFGTGRFWAGVVVFVVGKLVGTAVLARLFTLTRPALLQIGWFRRLYEGFTRLRDRVYAYVRSLRTYQAVRRWLGALRTRVRVWWRRLRGRRRD
jgi:hypothetical protein